MDSFLYFAKNAALGIGAIGIVATTLLYYFQDRLLYFPSMPQGARTDFINPAHFGLKEEDIWIKTKDGITIHCWFFRSPASSKSPTLIYFHGNAGNISHRLPNISDLVQTLYMNVLIVSYRGYGKSEGFATENGLKIDSEAVLDYVLTHLHDIEKNKIFLFGRSLGGAVACHLASKKPDLIRGIILENTFTSIADMIDVVLPIFKPFKSLLTNKWNNKDLVSKISVPILFLSGDSDELVPPSMMAELFKLSKSNPENTLAISHHHMLSVRGGKHNDTWTRKNVNYYETIAEWVDKVIASSSSSTSSQ